MLPTKHRLRDSADFSAVLRSRRSGRAPGPRLIVTVTPAHGSCSRVGFVVSKAVGNSVVRNRTARVLRHEMAALLPKLAGDHDIVIRATPAAGTASAESLRADLREQLPAAVARRRR
ncbi:ribonuclease P protein component [Flexivirga caeni]|uniref:Ribonuclease P protein component n=1 Tax=Flexivirga caeni TaxID=2294115 RepID=A0A3M9M3Z2_9MICO|nr:ribonuclease P protein component [Flexivirga caeni]RNI19653.1 ribonuclease P protein component [Flexivirga caeni]